MHRLLFLPYRLLAGLVALSATSVLSVSEVRAGCGDYVVIGEVPAELLAAVHSGPLDASAAMLPAELASAAFGAEAADHGRPPCHGPRCGSSDEPLPQPVSHSLSRSTELPSAAALTTAVTLQRPSRRLRRTEPRVATVRISGAPLRPPEAIVTR